MTLYLIISTVGLLLKIALSMPTLLGRRHDGDGLTSTLVVFIYGFIAYSVTQVLIFSPEEWIMALSIERLYLMRVHYFLDVVCLISGVYLLLSYLGYEKHQLPISKLLITACVLTGGFFLLFTNSFISADIGQSLDNTELHLGGGYTGHLIYLPRVLMFLSLIALCILFSRVYSASTENTHQVKSLYAVGASFFYTFNCFIGTFAAYPLIISFRGTFYFIVILLIMRKSELYDLRVSTPHTYESKALSEFRSCFREYVSDNLEHKAFINAIERSLVTYKINKASSFNDSHNSELPLVAKSMGVSLGLVYALIKKHHINTTDEQ